MDSHETEDPVLHPTRRAIALRTLLLLPAWALFFFWWLVVLRRVTWPEVRYAILFIVITGIIVLAMTTAWIAHNIRIFRRLGARRQGVWTVEENFTHDVLGRPLTFGGDPALTRQARLVRVVLESYRTDGRTEERKSYAPGPARLSGEARPAGPAG